MASGKISPAQLKPTLPPIFYMTDDGARDASAALMSFGDRDSTAAAAGDFTHTYLALLPRDVRAHVDRLVRARWLDTGVLQGVNIALGANASITECVVMRNGDYVCILTDFVSDSKIEVRAGGLSLLCVFVCLCMCTCTYTYTYTYTGMPTMCLTLP